MISAGGGRGYRRRKASRVQGVHGVGHRGEREFPQGQDSTASWQGPETSPKHIGTAQPAWLGGPPEDALCSPALAAPRPASPDLSRMQHQVLCTNFADRLCKDAQKHAQGWPGADSSRDGEKVTSWGSGWVELGSRWKPQLSTHHCPCSLLCCCSGVCFSEGVPRAQGWGSPGLLAG